MSKEKVQQRYSGEFKQKVIETMHEEKLSIREVSPNVYPEKEIVLLVSAPSAKQTEDERTSIKTNMNVNIFFISTIHPFKCVLREEDNHKLLFKIFSSIIIPPSNLVVLLYPPRFVKCFW